MSTENDRSGPPVLSQPEGDPLERQRVHVDSRLRRPDGSRCSADRPGLFSAYRERLVANATPLSTWKELGPKPLAQPLGIETTVSGRVADLALAPSEPERIYLASANGGVWRSDDRGQQWEFTMAAFDLDPRAPGADTLACGAIAVDPNDADRVYVGTGEGGAGALLGVGPLVSRVGGRPSQPGTPAWEVEEVDHDSPPLLGQSFYALALSPDDSEIVLGATDAGLYRRDSATTPARWHQVFEGTFTSVVAGRRNDGVAVFFAASLDGLWTVEAASHADPDAWSGVGNDFQPDSLGRISLAIPGEDADTLFALVADAGGRFAGVHRWQRASDTWQRLAGAPPRLFSEDGGTWAQALAVDPNDPERFFLGGTTLLVDDIHMGALYRCRLEPGSPRIGFSFVGYGVHADIQALAFEPGSSDRLWVGCDGGVFVTDHAEAHGLVFHSRNETLATITLNHLGQHPDSEELYCGSQDNGLVRYPGGGNQRWETVVEGDCGHVIVSWADPRRVLASIYERFLVRLVPELDGPDFVELPLAEDETVLFYPPLAGTPRPEEPSPANQHQADRVAFGSERVWISESFGEEGSWVSIPHDNLDDDRLPSPCRSLAFASAGRLYAGTEGGEVYRFDFDEVTGSWERRALAAPLTSTWFRTPVTDIAIDLADSSGDSIYLALGGPLEIDGRPDDRRLWHYDGPNEAWTPKSGPPDDPCHRLLPVQHNAIVIDPEQPHRLWVGADIGVWYSDDGGDRWQPFQDGLPDASVVDLRLHPGLRLLRASTHGRGCFEISIDF